MGRVVGIDFGRKRIGLAVTDPLQIIASPLTTVNPAEFELFMGDYLKTETVDAFVVGYPVKLNNTPGDTIRLLEVFIRRLNKLFPTIPVHKIDERFTSIIAQRAIIDGGVKKNDRQDKKLVDRISATLILQSYLERH